ncbi:hypothetical protein FGO68_gene4384 [Halteria grandinella]|uniref:Uncharacterized protein n=1 Tax=Halteria grandinella TaxID=5974 RepID=A0A8J8NGJ1_HALGN|nr:hypothetical protein FGO68_gene4384 [Halteria grandinella]
MIGFAIGTPIQGLRLFFPYTCVRNILQVGVESFDFYMFYQLLLTGDVVKGSIFTGQSLFSIIIELPQIVSTCIPGAPASDLAELLSAFSDSLMYLFKFFIYVDTAINYFFQEEWILSGFYGMTSLLNVVSYIAYRAFNNGADSAVI